MLETRFADPITAVDLSLRHVCFGSAMGRMAFYDIRMDKDIVLSDSQPELIRGVSTTGTQIQRSSLLFADAVDLRALSFMFNYQFSI